MPQPQLSFDQVYDAYRKSGSQQSLGDWSAFANDVTGSDAYSQGRQSLLPGLIKKGSYWIDQGLEATGLPEKTAEIGRSVFDYFGADPEYGAEIGRELPRGFVDMAPMFIPYVGPALRLGGAGAMMAGHTYADTDSVGRAAVSAATPFIGAGAGQAGINALAKTGLVNPVVKTMEMLTKAGNPTGRLVSSAFLEGAKDKTLGYLAQQTGAMAAMEATGYATEAIASETWNPYEGRSVKDWALGMVLGQVPYMAQDLVGLATQPMRVGKETPVYKAPPPEKAPEVDPSNISSQDAMRRSFDLDRAKAVAEAMKIDEPDRRQQAIDDALAMHGYKTDMLEGRQPALQKMLWADPNVQETKTIYDQLIALRSVPPSGDSQPTFIRNDGLRQLRDRLLAFKDRDHNEVTSEKDLAEIVSETELLEGASDELVVPEGFDPATGKVVLDSSSELRDEVSDVLMQNGAGAEEAVVDSTVGVRNSVVERGQRKVRASDMSKANEFEAVSRKPVSELEQAGVNEVLQLMRASSGSEVEPKRLINAWYNWRERLQAGGREGVEPIADLRGILGRVVTRARLPKQLEASRFEKDEKGQTVGFADRAQAQAYADNLNKGLKEDSPFTYAPYSDAGRNGPGADTPFGVKRKYRSEADRKIHEVERGAKEPEVVAEAKAVVDVVTDTNSDPDAKMARLVARQALAKFLTENGKELGLDEPKLLTLFAKIKSREADPAEMQKALAKMLAAKREAKADDDFFSDRDEEQYEDDSQRSAAKKRGSANDRVVEQPSIMPSPEETLREVIKLSGGNASEQDLFGRFLSGVFDLGRIPHQKLGVIINNDPKNQIWGLGNRSAGGNRMAWLAPMDTELTPKGAREMGIALMHETGHVIEGAVRGGFAPKEVLRTNEVFQKFLKDRPEKAMEFFRMWRDQLPKDYHNLQSLNEMLDGSAYTKQAHELYATGMALWAADQMKAEEAKAWGVLAPPEAKSWFKELTKYAHRMIGALRSAVFMRKNEVTPEFHQSLQAIRDMYSATVKGIREAEVSMETLRSWAANGTEDVWAFQTKGRKFFDTTKAGAQRSLEGGAKEVGTWEKAWNEAIRTLDGLGRSLPVFNRTVAQVHQHAPTISRFRNQIMGSVVGGVNPDTGTISMSGPEAKMYRSVQREADAHLNGLASEIMQWKQLAGEGTKFSIEQLKSSNPSWPPSGTRKRSLWTEFSALPEAKKKAVLHTIAGLENGHATNARQTVETQFETGRNLMMMYFGKSLAKERWGQAPDLVNKFTQAVDQAMQADPGTKLVGEKSLESLRKIINNDAVFQGALDMWMDTHVGVKELQEFYASKPGHQSMMRTGKYLARAYDAKGEQYTDAVQDMNEYKEWQAKARSAGFVRFDEPQIIDQKNNFNISDDTLSVLDGIEKRRQDRIQNMDLPEDLRAVLLDATNVSGDVARMMAAKDVRLPADIKGIAGGERRKIPGSMDMIETQKLFFNVSSRLNANRLMKTRLAYELSNPELTRFPREVESFKRQVENYMRPDSNVVRALQRTNSVMFLGGNLSSVMMNLMQTPMTALPELLNQGISSFKGLGLLSSAVKDVGAFSAHLLAENAGLYDEHKAIKKMKNKDEQMFMTWANTEGLLSVSSLAELSDLNADAAIDLNRVGHYDRPMKPAEKAKSAISNFANFSMKAFAASEQFNKRIALLLGYRAAKEKLGANAPKEDLYNSARDFMYATTYAGGRANRPLLQGDTGVFGAAAYSLSGYTMGWLNQVARYLQHWKGAEYLNLRPEERTQAKKAALSMLGIQVGAAGVMGLPFAGAMLKVMEKLTGENLEGQIYQKLGALFDQDDEEGGGLGNVVMTGLANAAVASAGMPIDLGSRWGLNQVLGFNSFDGFNGDSVFGPTGSLVSSALAGMKSSFQGDFGSAAKQFAPAAIKKAVSYYVNGGQAETSKGSMVEMGDAETLGYVVGFNSQKLAALQKYRGIEIAQEEANALDRAKETNEILNLLQSNPTAAQQKVQEVVSNGAGVESHASVARRVAEAAAEKVYPKDVRATAGKKSGEFLMDVAQTMGVPIPQANQVARRSYIDQVMMMLGAQPPRQSRREVRKLQRQDEVRSEYTPFGSVR
jgi:hypothetical protein